MLRRFLSWLNRKTRFMATPEESAYLSYHDIKQRIKEGKEP